LCCNRVAVIILSLLLVSTQIGVNLPYQDQHDNYVFHNYGHDVLDPLPEGAMLLVAGIVIYHRICSLFKLLFSQVTCIQM
jgi:hypothetical protein